ncbi:cytochrome c oxidase assembly protein [Vibrio sp. SCSIO 43136]|uniref:cytochrome c oxidase assembly protein n=1 Tax=Vibrio sp. SCSIO 43136 TaxID=2819101 RepID=UPI0020758F43|nr:cytochrome c oxidase assembly protein [Vibrio sp. SCSIO 43136]USD65051.1 cytochrome c oxidase assembly protein [Vibrio sp. SCSIO 43136]
MAQNSHRKLTLGLLAAVVGMFGFGFALVPLYDIMCDVLGINGKTNSESVAAPSAMSIDTSRSVKVQLMAHIPPNMPWSFAPAVTEISVHPGEVIETHFVAQNLGQSAITGQAVPSVAPGLGANYFNKIECFCFNRQPLASQESAQLPVIFYIEPDIPDSIHTLTLSYTLFNITEANEPTLAMAQGGEQ